MSQQSRRFDACIFDLDGTLANTLTSIAHFGNTTLEEFGLPPIPVERYKQLVGNGADLLMRRMLKTVGAEFSPERLRQFRAFYDRCYEEDPMALVEPYPGMVELLRRLKQAGFQVGVLSNKPDNVAGEIVRAMFGELVDQAHGQRPEYPTKPDPAAVLRMAADFGVEPGRVLYCGDSGVDMQTGTNAGMHPCGVLWGFRGEEELRENGAEFLVRTAEELWETASAPNPLPRVLKPAPAFSYVFLTNPAQSLFWVEQTGLLAYNTLCTVTRAASRLFQRVWPPLSQPKRWFLHERKEYGGPAAGAADAARNAHRRGRCAAGNFRRSAVRGVWHLQAGDGTALQPD